jgi:hypothetical protein
MIVVLVATLALALLLTTNGVSSNFMKAISVNFTVAREINISNVVVSWDLSVLIFGLAVFITSVSLFLLYIVAVACSIFLTVLDPLLRMFPMICIAPVVESYSHCHENTRI